MERLEFCLHCRLLAHLHRCQYLCESAVAVLLHPPRFLRPVSGSCTQSLSQFAASWVCVAGILRLTNQTFDEMQRTPIGHDTYRSSKSPLRMELFKVRVIEWQFYLLDSTLDNEFSTFITGEECYVDSATFDAFSVLIEDSVHFCALPRE